MRQTFTRQALYDLAWSEPIQALAKQLSLSDRGLAKICASANIPVPPRGYWAKMQAGKPVTRRDLPRRALGQSDVVVVGGDGGGPTDEEILAAPIPSPPAFTPDMGTVRAEAAVLVAKAPLPLRATRRWHPQIQKLLKADEERARKRRADPLPLSRDELIFDTLFESRRLRLLNALFVCLSHCGARPHVSEKYGRRISITLGTTRVPLVLDAASATELIEREREGYSFTPRGPNDRMRLAIWWSNENLAPSWEDSAGEPLETRLREIAAAILVFAEQAVRKAAMWDHARRTKRKAELEEAARQRQAEEDRRRKGRLVRLDKARVDHLLTQAHALHQAQQIRVYVEAVRTVNARTADPMTDADLEAWSSWARAQADRIDPIVSGAFKEHPVATDNSDDA